MHRYKSFVNAQHASHTERLERLQSSRVLRTSACADIFSVPDHAIRHGTVSYNDLSDLEGA